MTLINSKVELKLNWTNHCVLAANSNANDFGNFNEYTLQTNIDIFSNQTLEVLTDFLFWFI